MKRVKLINCMGAKEDNTGKVVDMYETVDELLKVFPDACVEDAEWCLKCRGCVGFTESRFTGEWIQVYRNEIKQVEEDEN